MKNLTPAQIILSFLLFLLPERGFSWGMIGHRVVGGVAWEHLGPKAKKEVQRLLGKESLAMSGNWADFIRSDPHWDVAAPWHYVNFTKEAKGYDGEIASKSGDVVQAIVFFEKVLGDFKIEDRKRAIALKFLAHFVGDIHQPLHAGLAEDWGGNKVELHWFSTPSNLHRVWDEHLVDHQQLSYTEWVAHLNQVSPQEKERLMNSTVLDWAKESLDLRDGCYTKEKRIGYDYNFSHFPTVSKRLLEGGLRLAGLLNRVFENKNYTKEQLKELQKVPQNIKVPW